MPEHDNRRPRMWDIQDDYQEAQALHLQQFAKTKGYSCLGKFLSDMIGDGTISYAFLAENYGLPRHTIIKIIIKDEQRIPDARTPYLEHQMTNARNRYGWTPEEIKATGKNPRVRKNPGFQNALQAAEDDSHEVIRLYGPQKCFYNLYGEILRFDYYAERWIGLALQRFALDPIDERLTVGKTFQVPVGRTLTGPKLRLDYVIPVGKDERNVRDIFEPHAVSRRDREMGFTTLDEVKAYRTAILRGTGRFPNAEIHMFTDPADTLFYLNEYAYPNLRREHPLNRRFWGKISDDEFTSEMNSIAERTKLYDQGRL